MEIPDEVLIPGIYSTFIFLLIGYVFGETIFFFDASTYTNIQDLVVDHIIGATILYTFLYIQILIPGGIHLLQWKKYKTLGELFLNYFTFFFTLPFSLFQKKDTREGEEEIPTWVGGGDLRIAIFIWLTLWTIHGISSFVFAYILGSIVWISLLIIQSVKKTKMKKEIAFWPFLWIGWILSILFHEQILNYFTN
jgi:prepilin signal peptidase PulO-like enzyme (type II secretory pathway)